MPCHYLDLKIRLQNLVAQKVFKDICTPDEPCFTVLYQHLCRLEARVEIAAHLKAIGAGIVKCQVITFPYFVQHPVPGKGVGLADVTYYGIYSLRPVRVRYIGDLMVRVVEHGPDQVVKTRVHTHKYCCRCLLDHIGLYCKVAALTHQVLTRFKPNL